MSLNYTKKTIDNFLHPKNSGEVKNADARADVGNMVCGDQLTFTIKVVDGKIKELKYLSFGCASNIATASVLSEKVKGMTLAQAKKFNWNEIVSDLGGLPTQKIHCSVLAVEGLQKVIAVYEKNQAKMAGKPAVAKKAVTKKVAAKKPVAKKVAIKKPVNKKLKK
ncbi:MAG: iron-sulfur cluster assembly scaffold protein [Candidatus Falkowbacteria bacterium]